jgi:hypothetical protein
VCVEGVGCYKWFANMSRLFTHPNQASCTAHARHRHPTLTHALQPHAPHATTRRPDQTPTTPPLPHRSYLTHCCAQKRRRPTNSLRAMAVRSTRPGPRRERVPWPGRRGGGAGRGPASLGLSPAPRGALPHAVPKPEGAPDVASINHAQTHAHTQHNEQPPYASAGEARLPAPPKRGASRSGECHA